MYTTLHHSPKRIELDPIEPSSPFRHDPSSSAPHMPSSGPSPKPAKGRREWCPIAHSLTFSKFLHSCTMAARARTSLALGLYWNTLGVTSALHMADWRRASMQ